MAVATVSLRQNNVIMGELRDKVIAADAENGDVNAALDQLSNHIFSHMNTQMSQPVNLVGSFNRAVERARANAEQNGANPEIYREAQAACENPNVVLTVRAQCVYDYVIGNSPEGTDVSELDIPAKELFVYDFISPRWSSDIAGISIVATIITFALALVRFRMAK